MKQVAEVKLIWWANILLYIPFASFLFNSEWLITKIAMIRFVDEPWTKVSKMGNQAFDYTHIVLLAELKIG